MNLRRIKHTLMRMSPEEKVIGIGSLVILSGTVMPWYTVVMNFDNKPDIATGFTGDLGVIGFVIFLMSLLSLLVLVAENMRIPLPQFGYKKEQILFFFLGQTFFLTLLTMAIYTKRSLGFTDAGLRFGIYMVLLGAFFGGLSAFALIQKSRKHEVEEFFHHDDEPMEELAITERVSPGESQQSHSAVEVEVEQMIEEEPEPLFFGEDEQVIEKLAETEATDTPEYVPEDDMIEDVQEVQRTEEPEASEASKSSLGGGFYQDKM